MKVYTEVGHTADYSVRLESETLPGLFIQAAAAVRELCGIQAEEVDPGPRSLSLEEPDLETLLVSWLEELLFVIEVENEVWKPVMVDLESSSLKAEFLAYQVNQQQREIKAVTYHKLKLVEAQTGWSAVLVFDV